MAFDLHGTADACLDEDSQLDDASGFDEAGLNDFG
jgi:hypothetical protein